MHHDDAGDANQPGDRRDVANEVEIEFLVERRVDCIGRADQQERVAVGRRAHDRLGRDIAAPPGRLSITNG